MSGTPVHGGTHGAERRATLRWRAASLTETVCRTAFTHHGDRAGKGAR
ncbi:DUF6380 family protein [Streptomyces flaveolus]|uniref:DUF6380 family protein n=1 Tax=Streptomyces flaveolus TaxID=67297 RepID=A0ABV1VL99_9ACTN|nr:MULTISPECIES: DUF6380 family protein [Streptomyces]